MVLADADTDSGGVLWVIIAAVLFVYFLPTIIAMLRRHSSAFAIFALNLFAGWSFIGWLIAIVWSLKADR